MNVYFVTQDENNSYDTYDSLVCFAKNEEEASKTLPNKYMEWDDTYSTWCSSPDQTEVIYLGEAPEDTEAGVITTSFNAG